MRKLLLAGLSVALLIGGAVVAAGLPVTAASSAAAPAPGNRTTTLITGDQVITTGRGEALRVLGVKPGASGSVTSRRNPTARRCATCRSA